MVLSKLSLRVMSALARISGGKDLTADPNPEAAVAAVFGNTPPATVNYRRTPLWTKGWTLALIMGLLSLEWALRRWKGLA